MDSNSFDRGEFYLVNFIGSDADGGANIAFQPHSQVVSLEPGNTTVVLPACGGGSCIIDSKVTAPFYVWMRTHILSGDGFGDAFLSEISTGRSFDQMGKIGAITYEPGKDANELTFCNPNLPSNGTTVLEVTVSQLRQPLNQVGSSARTLKTLKTDDDRTRRHHLHPTFQAPAVGAPADWSPISVGVYGAVGDGKTDDADAIQLAINAAIKDGSRLVIVPPGVLAWGERPAWPAFTQAIPRHYRPWSSEGHAARAQWVAARAEGCAEPRCVNGICDRVIHRARGSQPRPAQNRR